MRNVFPKIKSKYGGYTVRILFHDENRGERFFDSEWSVCDYLEPGRFTLGCGVNWEGRPNPDDPAARSIGQALQVGDTVSVCPTLWNMRGRKATKSYAVRVAAVETDEHGGVVVNYEAP